MALCYRAVGLHSEAEDCYQSIVDSGCDGIEIRAQLLSMVSQDHTSDRLKEILRQLHRNANDHVEPDLAMNRAHPTHNHSLQPRSTMALGSRLLSKTSSQERRRCRQKQQLREQERDGKIYDCYLRLEASSEKSRVRDEHARNVWTTAAKEMIEDFRSNSIFYPTDKYMRFFGYSSKARATSAAAKPGSLYSEKLHNEADPSSHSGKSIVWHVILFFSNCSSRSTDTADVPEQYRGIAFSTWLDIFLEYAFYLAESASLALAYDIIVAARDANIFYHTPDSMLLIHICWLSTFFFNVLLSTYH